LRDRARRWRTVLAWATAAVLLAFIAASPIVRPDFAKNFLAMPFLFFVPLAGLAGLVFLLRRPSRDGVAFTATLPGFAAFLGSAADGLYPTLLPALPGSAHPGLYIYNSASPEGGLRIALAIYLTGMVIVLVYLARIYKVWSGPVGRSY